MDTKVDGIDVTKPEFHKAAKVHDWRNHVGGYMRKLWPLLPVEVQIAAALDAEEEAGREEWD